MLRIQAPIVIIPTADAKLALGEHLQAAGLAAYREIAVAAKGSDCSASRASASLPVKASAAARCAYGSGLLVPTTIDQRAQSIA
jgi:hypothetical protein